MELDVAFGPIADLIADPTIEEIWINSPQRIFIARNGLSELTNLVLTSNEVRELVDRTLIWSGRRLDMSHPFVDARLPDGSRLHVAIPEITSQHWAVNIRKHLLQHLTIENLAERGAMNSVIAQTLKNSVRAGLNILVSGSTQSGKTTLLNALVSATPIHERVITIEEVFELKPMLPDLVALQTRSENLQGDGAIPLRRLIKEALRMRPSRLVIGEIREAESWDMLIALNSGIPGMATIHANSATEAIRKLQTLPLLAGENITQDFLTPTVFRALDYVIHVGLDSAGVRRVLQVVKVLDRAENFHIDLEPIFTWSQGQYQRGFHV